MDWYPLYNSVRIALISTIIIFFAGIAAAYYVARLPRAVKGVLDAVFTLPLVLPPTVVGYLLLRVLGPRQAARSAARMRGCSGACACRAAVRASLQVPCSRSRVRSANTARRA